MKHAYLILAHHEFLVLSTLLELLDDERNDIYIHFDKKVTDIPSISCKKSHLTILDNRVDVKWGTYSQIKAEYALMKTAYKNGMYSYYHLISGVHLPLCNQDSIHSFFNTRGESVLQLWKKEQSDILSKLCRYNIITRHFMDFQTNKWKISRFIWKSANTLQKYLHIKRNTDVVFKKSDNWVSLTSDAVRLLIDQEKLARRIFRFTFCGDEYFVATMLHIFGYPIHDTHLLLRVEFVNTTPKVYTLNDYNSLMSSGCLFARKFSSSHMDIVNKIKEAVL